MKYPVAKGIIYVLLLLLLSLLMLGGYQAVKNVWLLITYEHVSSRVNSCELKFQRGGGRSLSGRRQLKYTPIVRLDDVFIKSNVYVSYEFCSEDIGSEVLVLINPKDNSEGYIVKFVYFWLKPLAMIFGSFIALVVFIFPILKGLKIMEKEG